MSDRDEGSLSGSQAGSAKGSGSPAESGRVTRSRSGSPDSQHSHNSAASKGARGPPTRDHQRASRSRSRSNRRYRSRSYSRSPRYSRSRSRSRKRYYSRSRSGSPHNSSGNRKRSRYSRSRSRSPHHAYGYRGRRNVRSRSQSPMSRRKRHVGNRDNPKESRCVGVFGLSLYTQERDLREAFGRYGPIEEVQIVYDHQTGRSRGFAFVYYRTRDDAEEAKEKAAGTEIDGRRIRVDFSITERAHTPTPGIYLGKPTHPSGGHSSKGSRPWGRGSNRSGYGRRSQSPQYHRGGRGRYSYSRSRSRSYSPRMKEE